MENFEPMIDYQFVPGPFIDVLIKALKNRYTNFILIIEEINRANAASVFGDIFQLLDRNKNGESDYPVTFGPDIMNYLARNGIKDEMIKLPSNFFIWATMNNADRSWWRGISFSTAPISTNSIFELVSQTIPSSLFIMIQLY